MWTFCKNISQSTALFTFFISIFSYSVTFAQNPFDYGKTDSIYFISSSGIDRLGIEVIHIVDPEQEGQTGGMNQNINLSIIDFSNHHERLEDNWHVDYDSTQIPPLDSLIENALFINGSFWSFDDNRITMSGMEGYGTLCYREYQQTEHYTSAIQFCKHSTIVDERRIYYHPNGLPNYKVCCNSKEIEEELENDTIAGLPEGSFSDTTFYIYDAMWKLVGLVKMDNGEMTKSLPFSYSPNKRNEGYQVYLNKQKLETFVDAKIGARPELILIEIYRLAVLSFHYSKAQNQYIYTYEVDLE